MEKYLLLYYDGYLRRWIVFTPEEPIYLTENEFSQEGWAKAGFKLDTDRSFENNFDFTEVFKDDLTN